MPVNNRLAERFARRCRDLLTVSLAFALLALLLLILERVTKLLGFGDPAELADALGFMDDLFLRGLRFDLKLLASTLLMPWLLLPLMLILPERVVRLGGSVFLVLALAVMLWLGLTDIGYFAWYHKPIDVLIFGLLEDDTRAVFATMLSKPWIPALFALFFLLLLAMIKGFVALFRWLRGRIQPVPVAPVVWLAGVLVLGVLARGSLDGFPLQRKHASVSDNAFINSLVMNGVFDLYYAWRDHGVNSAALFQRDTLKAYGLESEQELLRKAGYDDGHPLIRRSRAPALKRPVHVVFVQMEGWSAEIARLDGPENQVLGHFRRHAAEDHFFLRFLATTYGTNPTIESLLLDAPVTPLSQSVARQTRFRMSHVRPFKRQGYDSLFLSGGYASWRNHDRFWPLQGFDRYLGRSEIERRFQVDASDNPWGVYDRYVFEYLEQELQQADARGKPLFSFVLTTNNHPPVRLPKDYERPPLKPSLWGFDDDDEEKLSTLSGYHYQTDQLGRFLDWLKASPLKDRVIVVATGDHPLRTFVDRSAVRDRFLRYAVPAYWYVPPALDRLKGVDTDLPASHNDLFPTLYELALPDAEYYAFGTPLMEKRRPTAIGRGAHQQYLIDEGMIDGRSDRLYRWADREPGVLETRAEPLDARQRRLLEQARYRRILREYLLVQDYRTARKGSVQR